MSSYINKKTMLFPFHEGDIRLLYPEIREDQTGDTFPCPEEFALIFETPEPSHDTETQYIEETMPIFEHDVYKRQWKIVTMTQEEIDNKAQAIIKAQELFKETQNNA